MLERTRVCSVGLGVCWKGLMLRAGRRDIRPGPEIMVGLWGPKTQCTGPGPFEGWGEVGGGGWVGEGKGGTPSYFLCTITEAV